MSQDKSIGHVLSVAAKTPVTSFEYFINSTAESIEAMYKNKKYMWLLFTIAVYILAIFVTYRYRRVGVYKSVPVGAMAIGLVTGTLAAINANQSSTASFGGAYLPWNKK